jgi:hypothetical protein
MALQSLNKSYNYTMKETSSQGNHDEKKVAILCADKNSSYFKLPNLLIYTSRENALSYTGSLPAICHPPCAMFSRDRMLSKYNEESIQLARHCYDICQINGGIIEQPAHSIMFDYLGIKPTMEVWQSWFGFRAKKRTWLYCDKVTLLPAPITFDLSTHSVEKLSSTMRARQTLQFSQWLVNSVRTSIIARST